MIEGPLKDSLQVLAEQRKLVKTIIDSIRKSSAKRDTVYREKVRLIAVVDTSFVNNVVDSAKDNLPEHIAAQLDSAVNTLKAAVVTRDKALKAAEDLIIDKDHEIRTQAHLIEIQDSIIETQKIQVDLWKKRAKSSSKLVTGILIGIGVGAAIF